MAKKDNFDFKTFFTDLKGTGVKDREVETRQERKYFLIVSEGARTEPIYFEHLGRMLPNKLLNTIEVHGAGDNTIRVVQKAIELREKRRLNKAMPPYNEVWAIFDKDDFPARRYNDAVALAERNGVETGQSNQSFELWYVLHFQFLQNALHRNDYIDILTKHLGFKYTKNTRKIVDELFHLGNVRRAIDWAKALEKMHVGETDSNSCPYTRVYVLVERLLDYMDGKIA